MQPDNPRQHRALFISDIHLGSKGCQAERLLGFLRDNDADCIYLVGRWTTPIQPVSWGKVKSIYLRR